MAIKLPRSNPSWRKQPQLMERYWDVAMKSIEKTLNAILDIPAIQAALAATAAAAATATSTANAATVTANAATVTATDAAADAAAATAAAAAAASEASLVNSYVANYSGSLITANSTGDVTIVAHDRVYGDTTLNPTVSVTGATISTGQASGSIIRVYYNDSSRAGGVVTYLYTVDPAPMPAQSGIKHSVGAVAIPASGSVGGGGIRPPGYAEP